MSKVETREILRDGGVTNLERRTFLGRSLSLGALTFLTGCDVTDSSAVQGALSGISRWNDQVQAALFNPNRLMPTYAESMAAKDFRFNAYYGEDDAPALDGKDYRLRLPGLIDAPNAWTLD